MSDDGYLVDMARQMKYKLDKYWGNVEKMNMMLYVAFILDPPYKFSYLQYFLRICMGQKQERKWKYGQICFV